MILKRKIRVEVRDCAMKSFYIHKKYVTSEYGEMTCSGGQAYIDALTVALFYTQLSYTYKANYDDELTIPGALCVLRGEVDSFTDASPRVGHNTQPRVEDGSHHGDVCAVPQQLAVLYAVIGRKPDMEYKVRYSAVSYQYSKISQY